MENTMSKHSLRLKKEAAAAVVTVATIVIAMFTYHAVRLIRETTRFAHEDSASRWDAQDQGNWSPRIPTGCNGDTE